MHGDLDGHRLPVVVRRGWRLGNSPVHGSEPEYGQHSDSGFRLDSVAYRLHVCRLELRSVDRREGRRCNGDDARGERHLYCAVDSERDLSAVVQRRRWLRNCPVDGYRPRSGQHPDSGCGIDAVADRLHVCGLELRSVDRCEGRRCLGDDARGKCDLHGSVDAELDVSAFIQRRRWLGNDSFDGDRFEPGQHSDSGRRLHSDQDRLHVCWLELRSVDRREGRWRNGDDARGKCDLHGSVDSQLKPGSESVAGTRRHREPQLHR